MFISLFATINLYQFKIWLIVETYLQYSTVSIVAAKFINVRQRLKHYKEKFQQIRNEAFSNKPFFEKIQLTMSVYITQNFVKQTKGGTAKLWDLGW